MAAKIKHRRDTAANWASNNPVLDDGELGYDKTNKRLKVGDGATPWLGLSFYEGLREGVPLKSQPLSNNVLIVSGAHGLGKVPSIVEYYLECLVAQHGYSVGDITKNINAVCTPAADETNVSLIRVNTTGAVNILPKAGGSSVSILSSPNWRWVVRSYA